MTGRPFSHDEISTAMSAGYDTTVPFEERRPTSPSVSGTVVCQDQQQIREECVAKVVNSGEDATDLRLPSGVRPISRTSEIVVDRGAGEAEIIAKVASQGVGPGVTTLGRSREGSDGSIGCAPDVVVGNFPEHGMGVQPVSRQEAMTNEDLAGSEPAVRSLVQPPPPETPRTEVAGESIISQTPGVAACSPGSVLERSRVRVTFSSPALGRVRAKAANVAVSDTLVMVFYRDDEDALIYEPPTCTSDNPLIVTVNGRDHRCMYGGFTANVDLGEPLFVVVLVRIDE